MTPRSSGITVPFHFDSPSTQFVRIELIESNVESRQWLPPNLEEWAFGLAVLFDVFGCQLVATDLTQDSGRDNTRVDRVVLFVDDETGMWRRFQELPFLALGIRNQAQIESTESAIVSVRYWDGVRFSLSSQRDHPCFVPTEKRIDLTVREYRFFVR